MGFIFYFDALLELITFPTLFALFLEILLHIFAITSGNIFNFIFEILIVIVVMVEYITSIQFLIHLVWFIFDVFIPIIIVVYISFHFLLDLTIFFTVEVCFFLFLSQFSHTTMSITCEISR